MFKRKFWVCLVLTIPILLLSESIQMWLGFKIEIPYQRMILFVLSAMIYVYGGLPFLQGMLAELKGRQPGMMTLVGTAISVAFFYSAATVFLIQGIDFFWELATLVDIMLFGHWLEAKSVLSASRALEELVKIMPTTAHRVENGEIMDVPVSQLKTGDTVLVRPGEKIPSDGKVTEGESYVNEALLTGESKPVRKEVASQVIGGAINGEGALTVEIEKTGEQTYIAQVIKLVRQAQESKSRTQDLANRASAMLFYAALGIAAVTFIAWFAVGDSAFGLERAVTVLVIACPHALGLAIPLVVALSTSITARSGILIRDRKAFEQVKDVDVVVFDKTGTLTTGRFGVTDTVAIIPEKTLLELAASVEVNSEHIMAKTIVEHARKNGVKPRQLDEFKAIPGKGAYGKVEAKEVYVGSSSLLEDLGIQAGDPKIQSLQEQGKTVVFVIINKKLAGAFALSDVIREESFEAVNKLKQAGKRVFMLTGDSEEVAQTVAGKLGIKEYFAQVLPDKKVEKIRLLQQKGLKTAMVGDGINDAAALVTADVGIAIGAGTDVAIESADVILVRNDPRDVVKVIDLSKKTYSKMVQNLWWAAGYNIVAIPLAAGILYSVGVVLTPAVGALLMSLSTVIVAVNSQTLRKYEPKVEFAVKRTIVTDPVCGMQLEPEQAYSQMQFEGQTYYFCSKDCEDKFRENPSKYASKLGKKMEEAEEAHHH